jgi:hypothetical protein
MNNESAPETHASATVGAVIKPWLIAGLVIALASNVLLSAILIIKLSGFEDICVQDWKNFCHVSE